MTAVLLGRKVGMTRRYDKDGKNVPVTIIQAGPCFVTQIKTADHDGYEAVQIGFEDVKPRNSTMQVIGHDAKAGRAPLRMHREFRVAGDDAGSYTLGQEITVDAFEGVKYVDVVGTSKGKGFAGVMKRHNFKGLCASHGTERKHRSPGSISGRSSNRGTGKPKRGLRMPGHMGAERVTARSLELIEHDKQRNLLIVKGAVPGARDGLLVIRQAVRLYKGKARLAAAS
ncbi:MAG: 50S ribosomal protein L3 [Phycisphaeraceae bacterium]|nr:50S ribosomal protein L3 [Phycisphaeraceae bacterium]